MLMMLPHMILAGSLGTISLVTFGLRSYALGYRLATRDFRGDLYWCLGVGVLLPLLVLSLWGPTALEIGCQGVALLLPALLLERILSWPSRQHQAGEPLLRLGPPPSTRLRQISGGILMSWSLLAFRHLNHEPLSRTYFLTTLGLLAGFYIVLTGLNERILTSQGICDFGGTVYWRDISAYTWSESMKTWQWWWLPRIEYQCLILKLKTTPTLWPILATVGYYIPQQDQDCVKALLHQHCPGSSSSSVISNESKVESVGSSHSGQTHPQPLPREEQQPSTPEH